MKVTKFDNLKLVYLELIKEFESIDDELIQNLVASWSMSMKQIEGFLETKQIKKSKMTSGLEEGIREMPEIFRDLPSTARDEAQQKFNQIVSSNIPDFFGK